MASLIKKFTDNSFLEYDKGGFDEWCVYLSRPNKTRYAPKDNEYFNFFKNIGLKYGSQKVYNDFVKIYNLTSKSIETTVLNEINNIAGEYGQDYLELDIWFTVVYAGMVAEENKAFTRLGKRIKRLGMHQILLQNLPSEVAANFSRGKPWRELHNLMKQLDF